MSDFLLFSDASFDRDLEAGVGAMLMLSEGQPPQQIPVETRVMKASTIARLELMTALWALDRFRGTHGKKPGRVHLYTDCRSIEGLLPRRAKLEAAKFQSRRTSLPLANADLYRKFFTVYDELEPAITWVKGHTPTSERDDIQRNFARVDKAARSGLREYRLLRR